MRKYNKEETKIKELSETMNRLIVTAEIALKTSANCIELFCGDELSSTTKTNLIDISTNYIVALIGKCGEFLRKADEVEKEINAA